MRKTLSIIFAALSFFAMAFGQRPGRVAPAEEQEQGETKVVDFIADVMHPRTKGDSVISLIGNVVMHHNGAVITCDSAWRHSDKHLECFGRVLINKDSTFIYGDRAVYNGEVNTAQVFAPLIKVVDGDAVLYTYNFSFNTLDNIGRFWGTGTMHQKENRLESERGYYYSDTGDFICVDHVQATDPQYKLKSDSVKYNMDTEVAEFYTTTHIWNEKGEMLSAKAGKYYYKDARYEFTEDSYILTDKQEIWADSLVYNSNTEDAELRWNIQIRDEEQKAMAFGDFGQYWGEAEEGFLTRNPSIVTFDPESDSLYMRSDTMFVYSIAYELDYKEYDSLRRERLAAERAMLVAGGDIIHPEGAPQGDSLTVAPAPAQSVDGREAREERREFLDNWIEPGDTATRDDLRRMVAEQKRELYELGDTLTRDMMTATLLDSLIEAGVAAEDIEGQLLYNERRNALTEQGLPVSDSLIYEVLEAIGAFGARPVEKGAAPADSTMVKPGQAVAEEEAAGVVEKQGDVTGEEVAEEEAAAPPKLTRRQQRQLERRQKQEAEKQEKLEKAKEDITEQVEVLTDSTANVQAPPVLTDSMRRKMLEEMGIDPSTFTMPQDSTGSAPGELPGLPGAVPAVADSLGMVAADSTAAQQPEQDSLQRIVKAYYNVRIFRNDFQAVCDSLIGFSKDSTFHLYIDPILWNGANQITSDVMDIFTKNQELERAFFNGKPLMVSEVDTTRYNQIKGREMEAFFRDNDIFRHNVTGNAETLYYMMDEEAGEPNAFLVVHSANITFLIENRDMDKMIFRQNPDYIAYPIDDIPGDVAQFLEGFRWEAHRKPTLESVFDRRIRPTQREKYKDMIQPQFPLTERIGKEKTRLTELRLWEDRMDTLPPHAVEFVRKLGLE